MTVTLTFLYLNYPVWSRTRASSMDHQLLKLLNKFTSTSILKQIHLQILIRGLQSNAFVLPKLLSLSAQLFSLNYAINIFQSSQYLNVVAYNTIIKCFVGKNHKGALSIYNQMKALMVMPNSFTFTFLLRCFESFEALRDGMLIHAEIFKLGYGASIFVQNTLLDFYARCGGYFDFASQVFEEMPERDVVSWNSMIGAYMARGEIESAVQLFESMSERNTITWNSIVSGLCKAGNMDLALSVFERMPERNEVSWNSMISGYVRVSNMKAAQSIFNQMPRKTVVSWTTLISGYSMAGDIESAIHIFNKTPLKNVVSWNAMIAGYVHNHMFDQALAIFHNMLIDGECKPDQTTLICVLSACSHLGSLEHGKWVDSYMKRNKIDLSIPLGNALIDMFAKCGDVYNSLTIFHRMASKCIITWTTLISGLAVNGKCKEAITLFDRMSLEGIKPDDIIFIAVLSACTHGGLVEEGKRLFEQMVKEFDIKPRIEHYGCMVDLLGRAGRIQEAVRFIDSMHLKPNSVIWATLLSCCKIHGNGKLLEELTRKILDQEPSNPGYLMLISDLSASMGNWEDSSLYRVAMKQRGIQKVPGCSSIQVGNRVHEFLAKDTRHEQRNEIYCILDSLNGHLKGERN